MRANTLDSFWSYVTKGEDPDDCWIWTGPTISGGYALFKFRGQAIMAHRLSWEMVNRAVPDRPIRRMCGNLACVNPDHMRALSLDDYRAAHTLGRSNPKPKRESPTRPHRKLTIESVRDIRRLVAEGLTQKEAGVKFGISQASVSQIIRRQTWVE